MSSIIRENFRHTAGAPVGRTSVARTAGSAIRTREFSTRRLRDAEGPGTPLKQLPMRPRWAFGSGLIVSCDRDALDVVARLRSAHHPGRGPGVGGRHNVRRAALDDLHEDRA